MKVNWVHIQNLVSEAILNKEEKAHVLEQLDENIGRFALNYKLPYWHNLTENEYIEFARIVKLINEENPLPIVSNEAEYKLVVKEIFDYFGSRNANGELPSGIAKAMIEIDALYSENDFDTLNKKLKQIEEMM